MSRDAAAITALLLRRWCRACCAPTTRPPLQHVHRHPAGNQAVLALATVGDAARQVGISRSAFYKYKDAVQPFQNMHAGHIITFYALLKDNPGVLSNYLSIFANSGANILTINQTILTNGCAGVTISAETGDMSEELDDLMTRAAAAEGVLKFKIMAG